MNKVKHNIKEAYKALQYVYEEYPELGNDYSVYKSSVVSNRLFIIDLNEKYDLGVDPVKVDRIDYFKLSNHAAICKYGESLRRTISWSDDNRQPEEGEYLLNISFPTGPYIFSHNDGIDRSGKDKNRNKSNDT